jgi:hypothetical protein
LGSAGLRDALPLPIWWPAAAKGLQLLHRMGISGIAPD